jgi:hypothetical protein
MRAPKLPKFNLSRRGFFRTAAAGAAVGAVAVVTSGCSQASEDTTSDPVVVDSDSATIIRDEFEYSDAGLEATNTWTLPLGTVLRPAEGNWIPATIAGSSATPMVKAGVLSLTTGTLSEVVSEPLGAAATTVIYDVRCSDSAFAWVELDTSTRAWKLYASGFSQGALTGDTKTLWEADSNFDPAPLAVSGKKVIWQVQPSLTGSKTSTHSFCYLWEVGTSDAKAVVESAGRFSTKPTISGDNVILTPRVRADEGTYYGVTAYSLSDDMSTQVDQLVMPSTVKPFRATRIGEKFVISVEASYSSGGLLGKMGTYIGTKNGDFLRMDREPSEGPAGNGQVYIIKSQSSYYVVDGENRTYSSISSADRCVDYGEYPARQGECDTFVTFSTVKDANTGYPSSVTVRTFAL